MFRPIYHLRSLLIVPLLCLLACAGGDSYPPDVASALSAAGENAPELKRVIEHYRTEEDTLKLRAAYFLIGNMEEHCYVTYALVDTARNEIELDVRDYPNYDSLRVAAHTLEDSLGELDFTRKDKVLDLERISADYLINQIDLAFRAWREKPWAQQLSFQDFLTYVLPYRGSNEPLDDWRELFRQKYAGLEDKMEDPTDPIEAASLINDDIKTWFTFDARYYYHPADQSVSEMLESHMGRCEDMTNLAICALRANGIAVTSDYTPSWANAGGNHAWNAIVTPAGKVIPFMGAEANPGSYRLSNRLAKAYRKTYSQQPGNLIFQERKQESVPPWLKGKSYVDVTSDYVDVCDVNVALNRPLPDSVDIAYLCVFNSGEWQAVQWGRIANAEAAFTDMGVDIVYLPALYLNEKLVPCAPPILLQGDCQKVELTGKAQKKATLQLTSTTRRAEAVATDGIAKTSLTASKVYELFFWQDGWKSFGKAIATDRPLVFDGVPADALYWLVAEDSDKEERVFTYRDGRQIWW